MFDIANLVILQYCPRHEATFKCIFPYDIMTCGCAIDQRRTCCFGNWDLESANLVLRTEYLKRLEFNNQQVKAKDDFDRAFLEHIGIDPDSFFEN